MEYYLEFLFLLIQFLQDFAYIYYEEFGVELPFYPYHI